MARKKEPPVKVIFRIDHDNIVFALFPEIPGTNDPLTCSCYEHIGQHHSAHYDLCIRTSRPATRAQYAPLASELRSIGYNLVVKKRDARAAMYKARYAELNRWFQHRKAHRQG